MNRNKVNQEHKFSCKVQYFVSHTLKHFVHCSHNFQDQTLILQRQAYLSQIKLQFKYESLILKTAGKNKCDMFSRKRTVKRGCSQAAYWFIDNEMSIKSKIFPGKAFQKKESKDLRLLWWRNGKWTPLPRCFLTQQGKLLSCSTCYAQLRKITLE